MSYNWDPYRQQLKELLWTVVWILAWETHRNFLRQFSSQTGIFRSQEPRNYTDPCLRWKAKNPNLSFLFLSVLASHSLIPLCPTNPCLSAVMWLVRRDVFVCPSEFQDSSQPKKATDLQETVVQYWISYPDLQVTEVKASAHFQKELHTLLI